MRDHAQGSDMSAGHGARAAQEGRVALGNVLLGNVFSVLPSELAHQVEAEISAAGVKWGVGSRMNVLMTLVVAAPAGGGSATVHISGTLKNKLARTCITDLSDAVVGTVATGAYGIKCINNRKTAPMLIVSFELATALQQVQRVAVAMSNEKGHRGGRSW